MDARAEIEAKRERLAKLREQRQRLAASKSVSPSPEIVDVPTRAVETPVLVSPAPKPELQTVVSRIFCTEPVIYYTKKIQTEDPVVEEPEIEQFEQIVVEEKPVELPAPQPEQKRFTMESDKEKSFAAAKFLDRAWRIVARAKDSDNPNRTIFDHAQSAAESPFRPGPVFTGPQATVSSLEWAPKQPDVFAVSFRQINEGISGQSFVCVWNLRAPSEPEYTLLSNTDVLAVKFAPSQQYIYGAGFNGRILAWNLRQGHFKLLPFLKSTEDGHVFPVKALTVTGTSLLSCAEDGTFCSWAPDLLTKPQYKITLTSSSSILDGLGPSAPTALAVHPHDNTQYVLGTLDGSLYRGFSVETVTTPAGVKGEAFGQDGERHSAGITALSFRQSNQTTNTMAFMLSAGLDWVIKLWSVPLEGTAKCVATIYMDDITSDIAWAPNHPSIFASACQDVVQIWDLNRSRDTAVCSHKFPWPVSRIAWNLNRKLAVGGVDGTIQVCEIADDVFEHDDMSWSKFNDKFK